MTIEILGIEKNLKGTKITVKHSAVLSYTPAYTFFLRGMADLIDSKFHLECTEWNDLNCGILWAEDEFDNILGCICYDRSYKDSLIPQIYSILTFVDEKHRQTGVHKIMYRYFQQQVRNLKCSVIKSNVHHKNTIRLISAEKDGFVPLQYLMVKKI